MTSEDTDLKTRELVDREGRFGMAEGQIITIMQDKVQRVKRVQSEHDTKGIRYNDKNV